MSFPQLKSPALFAWILRSLLLAACLGYSIDFCLAQNEPPIVAVSFTGLKKTKPDFLLQFIHQKPGAKLDTAQIRQDIQFMNNTRLFIHVGYTIKDTVDGVHLNYSMDEVLTLLPNIKLGLVFGNYWFQLGGFEANLHGRNARLGAFYRYNERHSFQVNYINYYPRNSRIGGAVNLAKISTIEPIYFEDTATVYDFDNLTAKLTASYALNYRHLILFSGAYLKEDYVVNEDLSDMSPPGPSSNAFRKYQVELGHVVNKSNFNNQLFSGFSNETYLSLTHMGILDKEFYKIINMFHYYWRVGGKGNIATRLRTNITTNHPSPFAPFVIDSYINIRGAGNKVARGTAEVVLNTEYRQIIAQNKFWCLQTNLYVDAGSWRPPGKGLDQMLEQENIQLLTGAGFRVCANRYYGAVLRVDYGINILSPNIHGIVVGIGQYF